MILTVIRVQSHERLWRKALAATPDCLKLMRAGETACAPASDTDLTQQMTGSVTYSIIGPLKVAENLRVRVQ